jgi:hypothetical protein
MLGPSVFIASFKNLASTLPRLIAFSHPPTPKGVEGAVAVSLRGRQPPSEQRAGEDYGQEP